MFTTKQIAKLLRVRITSCCSTTAGQAAPFRYDAFQAIASWTPGNRYSLKDALFVFGYLFALFAIAGVVLYFRDRIEDAIWKKRNPPEKLAAEWKEYQGRVKTPDWDFYADHLQRDVPDAIRDLYSNTATIMSDNAESCGEQAIIRFGVIDATNLLDTREWIGADVVAVAYNLFGDPIYLRPGRDETNAVFVTCHDGGDTEQIAADVSEFVESIRLVADR